MPIKPENKALYHPQWREISRWIRGLGYCERCGVENGDTVVRHESKERGVVDREVRIVLTTAHLNHDPTDNRRENLQALCQRCHNRHDAPHRSRSRARTQTARQMELFA